jgi:hypothetical protein
MKLPIRHCVKAFEVVDAMHSIPTLQLKIVQPNFLIRKANIPSRKDRAAVPSGLDPESSRGYFRLRPVARAFRTETGR